MKKLILFLACAAVAFGATSCAEKTNEIKVISYNVRLSGGDGENHWDKRKHASINMINEEKPTVFGVQEAKSFKVLRDKNYGAPFISDHYPVVMTAKF